MIDTELLLTNYIQANYDDEELYVEITYDCPSEEQRQIVAWCSVSPDICAEEILDEICIIEDIFDGFEIEVCINGRCVTDDDYIADKLLYEN